MNMRKSFIYKAKGACCTEIQVELDGATVSHIAFTNGCNGNHQGLAALVKGRPADEVIADLEGIECRNGTSCPDQLACALRAAMASAISPAAR